MTERPHAQRNGLICAAIFAACFLLAWPFAEMGFIDDWSYVKSAQVFAETGRLTYNGWAAPMLGWQVAWGGLFIRLFGFSFTSVKLATFPVAILTLILFHAVLVRFGITARNAIFGTLTLGLSPLFLPLSASFLTDIYGLFAVVLCLYCCQRALASHGSASMIAWLSIAAVSSVLGGTARQTAWLGALVMMPSTAWLLRKRRGALLAAAVLWGGSFACISYCGHWLTKQPYARPGMTSILGLVKAFDHIRLASLRDLVGLVLFLILLVYPILVGSLPRIGKIGRPALIVIACILAPWTLFQWYFKWTLPWTSDLFLQMFSPGRNPTAVSDLREFILPLPARLVLSLLIIGTAMVFVAAVLAELRNPECAAASTPWREVFWLFAPFTLSCFALLLLLALDDIAVIDRYVLVFLPLAIVCLIRLHQQWLAPNLPRSSAVLLVIYAVLAITATHDWFAWQRARLIAIDEVRSSGVPPTAIAGGLEYRGWTQIENGGHINSLWVTNPPGTYQTSLEIPPVADGCKMFFSHLMPAVRPHYAVAFSRIPCTQPSNYPPVSYLAWLPPFHRTVDVQEIPWLKQ
jgi:hypothetical protein